MCTRQLQPSRFVLEERVSDPKGQAYQYVLANQIKAEQSRIEQYFIILRYRNIQMQVQKLMEECRIEDVSKLVPWQRLPAPSTFLRWLCQLGALSSASAHGLRVQRRCLAKGGAVRLWRHQTIESIVTRPQVSQV